MLRTTLVVLVLFGLPALVWSVAFLVALAAGPELGLNIVAGALSLLALGCSIVPVVEVACLMASPRQSIILEHWRKK